MKLSIFILLIGLFTVQFVYAQATDLFISEYLEGSSNNKAIEIYNGTDSDVDLSDYMIKKATNGAGWTESNYTFPENAVIGSYDVWVIANSSADQPILNAADETLPSASYNYFMGFNGDDAIGLFKSGTLIDLIGNPTEDPGSGWDVAGVTEATMNHTLIRKSSIAHGNTDWATSAGTNADDSEWIVNDEDDMTNIGMHSFDGAPDVIAPTIFSVTPTSATTINIIFSEEVTAETANAVSNYAITGLILDTASLQTDNKTVELTTSAQISNSLYVLTVNNIQDLAGNVIQENSTITFHGFYQPTYTPIRNIQDSLSFYEGQSVTIKGVVTIGDALLHPGKTQFYIQDDSGRGIQVYNNTPLGLTYRRGDYISVTGTIGLYTGSGDKYHDVQISNPTVTLLSQGESLPHSLTLIGDEDLTMNGTWGKVNGVISAIWDASQYGFYKITATMDNGVDTELMFWNSAVSPNSLSQYLEGDKITAYGIIAFYNATPQLTCGYAEDIGDYVVGGEYDFVSFDPELPLPNQETTLIFNDLNRKFDQVYIYWKKGNEFSYHYDLTEPSEDSTSFIYVFPPQKSGTRLEFYYKAYRNSIETLYPENAPEEFVAIDFYSSNLIAKLSLPAKPFNPGMGENFNITFAGNYGDKAILRIYNIEGKLKTTLYNGVIQHSSGIMTILWNGKDKNSNVLPIGLYICHLEVYDRDTGKTKTDKAPIMIGTQLK